MTEHLFFDCNAAIGPLPRKHREARWSRDHLLDDLDLAGIAGALVHQRLALNYDPMVGNRKLLEEIEDDRERLYPCWVALPNFSGEFPPVSEFMKELEDHDVRAVRIEPQVFGAPETERVWGELRDALLDQNLLCVLPTPGYSGKIDGFERMLEIFRNNKVLMVNHVWSQWRQVIAFMEEFPNLHIDFNLFQANRAMEHFAERFGAERCLFGTGLPDRAPGAARGFIDFSLLAEEQTRLIAGENLRRLLGGAGPAEIPKPGEWSDAITEAERQGEPIPCLATDARCHMGHDGANTVGKTVVALKGDAEGMIELTRRAGIDQTAVMSWVGPLSMDSEMGNEVVANAVSQFPEEIIGLATVNPEYDDEEKIQEIIQRYHIELGFPGLKTFTPAQVIDYDDPLFHTWYQFGNDHDLYLVLDPRGRENADTVVRRLAEKYPRLGIHLDHCGRGWDYTKWVVSLIKEYDNIWGQLNFTLVTNGVVEYMVEEVGADRVLFGTDAPMRDPRPQVSWLTFTRISEADKRKIFGENFAAIIEKAKRNLKATREEQG